MNVFTVAERPELCAPAREGEYTFPGGLAPLIVADGTGRYWEPNVWMRHPIA